MRLQLRTMLSASVLIIGMGLQLATSSLLQAAERFSHLHRATVFLKAGDYRQAVEACQSEVRETPSTRSYVFLTYVYHALDGYLEHLADTDQWVRVEQLYVNLIAGRPEELVDPPDVLARIAKELIHQAVRRQADMIAAMAARLDEAMVNRMWQEQASWRQSRPADWWFGAPPQWQWEGS